MKTLPKKTNLPEQEFTEFRKFLRTVLKKRVFIYSLILGGSALIIQLLLSEFSLPQFYAFGFMLVGFAWAAYQAYRELSLEHQKMLNPPSVERVKVSGMAISLLEGNEYTYSIFDPFHERNHLISRMQNTRGVKVRFDERGVCYVNDAIYYIMGRAGLEMNIQLHSVGDLPLDILSIEMDNDLNLNHIRFFHEGIFLQNVNPAFPLHLKGGNRIVLQARYKVSVNRGSSDALFAADFRALSRWITHMISMDTIDANGIRQTYVSEIKTLSRPLIDLYVKQWQDYDQEEYLVLAGQRRAAEL